MTRWPFQYRDQWYVLGPNQDARLASVAAGAVIEKVQLQLDGDAPFILTGRAVRTKYTSSLNQANLAGLKSKWAGPALDYKQSQYVLEALQMVYYGQSGNPKPIVPGVSYPANSVLTVDLKNTGASAITNLTFFWHGLKLFPWDTVAGYHYPKNFERSQTFAYPVPVSQLGVSETRQDQIFTVKQDADFVIRAGQGPLLFSTGGRTFAEVAVTFMDWDKKPYSNDYVPFDIYFGNGATPAVIPVGPGPSFVAPFGTGPGEPGLFTPEIYVPKNHQFLYSLQRTDGTGGSNQAEDFTFSLIGGKVFES